MILCGRKVRRTIMSQYETAARLDQAHSTTHRPRPEPDILNTRNESGADSYRSCGEVRPRATSIRADDHCRSGTSALVPRRRSNDVEGGAHARRLEEPNPERCTRSLRGLPNTARLRQCGKRTAGILALRTWARRGA